MRWVHQEGDQALEEAVTGALATKERLPQLDEILMQVDPNLVRWHTCGKGGAIHMAARRVVALGWSRNLGDVLEILVKRGATAWEPCESWDGGAFREGHVSTIAWIADGVDGNEWWGEKIMTALLDAGHHWGDLDKQATKTGELVRAHPAWRRQHLRTEAMNRRAEGKPKL